MPDLVPKMEVAVIMLDAELRLLSMTANVERLLFVRSMQLDRLVEEIGSLNGNVLLLQDARHVLRHSETIVREVICASGVRAVRRAQPYRTRTRRIDGVVITFVFDDTDLPQTSSEDVPPSMLVMSDLLNEVSDGQLSNLTRRQREIMDLVLAGHPSKAIAAALGISQRTVENHRASIMKRTGCRSIPELARVGLVASLQRVHATPMV